MFLYRWLMQKCGYHVCEEFTQWQTVEYEVRRINTRGGTIVGEYDVTERSGSVRSAAGRRK